MAVVIRGALNTIIVSKAVETVTVAKGFQTALTGNPRQPQNFQQSLCR